MINKTLAAGAIIKIGLILIIIAGFCRLQQIIIIRECESLEILDPADGGYNIIVGLSNESVEWWAGIDPNVYIDELKEVLEDFSIILWESTNHLFHVKSVQILIPNAWTNILEANISTTASYNNAHIQLSTSTSIPATENWISCGVAGLRINLPLSFIINSEAHNYGSKSKGLLNLWLRFRFGVWEEHGYPLHATTPYVYNVNDVEHEPWRLTSCNNTKLEGNFVSLNDAEQISCSTTNNGHTLMNESCRFVPAQSTIFQNSPSSSLMNFHWVNSINKLCNASSHDKTAPNRQNLYCGFRSVWEVIESSFDYRSLIKNEEELNVDEEMPELEFIIVSESQRPLFYILLDTGDTNLQIDDELYELWLNELTDLINAINFDTITTLVSYPNVDDDDDDDENTKVTTIVKQIDWINLQGNQDEFINKLEFMENWNESITYTDYDFRGPLIAAIAELKLRNHPAGAVFLILRTGNGFNSSRYAGIYEEDIGLDLKLHKINLYAIEIGHSLSGPTKPQLQYLATESGGASAFILVNSTSNNASESMQVVTGLIATKLNSDQQQRDVEEETQLMSYNIIYKEELKTISSTSAQRKYLLIPKRSDVDTLHIYVTSHAHPINYLRFQLLELGQPFQQRRQWNFEPESLAEPGAGWVYSKYINISTDEQTIEYNFWAWELYITIDHDADDVEPLNVNGMITVYGSKSTKSTISTLSSIGQSNTIQTQIFTSADGNHVFGCTAGNDHNEEPLRIYAKLTNENNLPIVLKSSKHYKHHDQVDDSYNNNNNNQTELIQIKLHGKLFHLESGTMSSSSLMNDDGYGADLVKADGIYSGYIYSRTEGLHKLYINLEDDNEGSSQPIETYHGVPFGTLLSIKQDQLEIKRTGTTLNTPYSIVGESSQLITITSKCTGKSFISRITDVKAEAMENSEIVRISFTVPSYISSEDQVVDDGYEFGFYMGIIIMSHNISKLFPPIDPTQVQVFLVNTTKEGQIVPTYLNISNNENSNVSSINVFGIEILDFRVPPTKSATSNIARIQAFRTSPEEESTSTTTEPSSPSPGSFCTDTCMIAVMSAAGFLFVVSLSLGVLWRLSRRKNSELQQLSNKEIREFVHGSSPPNHSIVSSKFNNKKDKKSTSTFFTQQSSLPAESSVTSQNEYLNTSELIQSLPYDAKYEISKSKLHIDSTELLGSGAFGEVYKGYVVNAPGTAPGKVLIVAVKTMKPSVDLEHFKVLLSEVKLMTHLCSSSSSSNGSNSNGHHPNIIKLIGACTKHIRKREVFLALEFCANGSLINYLQKISLTSQYNFKNLIDENYETYNVNQELLSQASLKTLHETNVISSWNLVKWSREIASGMEYLTSKYIIHGDLAARNILLDSGCIAKISDFGLSKQLVVYSKYGSNYGSPEAENSAGSCSSSNGGLPLPWKWMSPEVLKFMRFSPGSDIWSYGVTLWEIFSLGQIPYPGIHWSLEFVDGLESGSMRLKRPSYATLKIYEMMFKCWSLSVRKRPSFGSLKSFFDEQLTQFNNITSNSNSNNNHDYMALELEESIHKQILHEHDEGESEL